MLAVVGEEGAAPSHRSRARGAGAPEHETATETGGEEPEEQTAAGDEGGQEPIPAQPSKHLSRSPKQTRRRPKAETKPDSKPAPKQEADATYVTPLVRKLAAEHGVDLGLGDWHRGRRPDPQAGRTGRGRGGQEGRRGTRGSTRRRTRGSEAAPATAARPVETSSLRGTTEKMSRLRKTIAKRMVESLQVSAQLTATVEVDLTAISRIRARAKDDFKQREGASLSYLPFITKAAVEALKVYPKVNATIDTEAGEITYPDAEHIGIAVDTEKGSAGAGDQGRR